MNESASEKVLWTKGGLFLLLGCVASGLLLMLVGNVSVAVLLVVAIWSFCRVSHLAQRIMEKQPIPCFYSARLTALFNYCMYVFDRCRPTLDANLDPSNSSALEINRTEAISRLAYMWFAIAATSMLLIPNIYQESVRVGGLVNGLFESMWIGWCAVIAAVCTITSALVKLPLTYRISLTYAVLSFLAFMSALGLSFGHGGIPTLMPTILMLWIYATTAYLMGFAILWFYRLSSLCQLEICSNDLLANSSANNHSSEQISIRFILVATTGIATVLALIRTSVPNRLEEFAFVLYIVGIGCGIVACVTLVTIPLLNLFFSRARSHWLTHASLVALGVAILPFAIMFAVSHIPTPERIPSNNKFGTSEYLGMYAFFFSYTVLLSIIFWTFSRAGIRLVKQTVISANSSDFGSANALRG